MSRILLILLMFVACAAPPIPAPPPEADKQQPAPSTQNLEPKETALPTFIPALIGLFVFSLLPGVALLDRRRPFIEQLGTSVAISVAFNSFLVMLLVLFKVYTLVMGWIWLAILPGNHALDPSRPRLDPAEVSGTVIYDARVRP